MRAIPPHQREVFPVPRDAEPALEPPTTSQDSTLRDYWRIIAKRRRLVVLVLLLAVGFGLLITFQARRLYTASVLLKIDATSPSVTGLGEISPGGAEYFQTQVALLESRALAARVIKELNLQSNPRFIGIESPLEQLPKRLIGRLQSVLVSVYNVVQNWQGDAPPPRAGPPNAEDFELGVQPNLITRYLNYVEVEPLRNTSLVRVRFTTPDSRLAQQLAATHATSFIRMNLETRFDLTKEAREFLEKKLAELKVKVEASEQALQQFRQAHGVVSIEGNQNVILDRMVDINKRLTEARAQRIELESLSRMVKNKDFEYLSEIVDNNLIVQLKIRLEGLEAEAARLSTIFKPDHPRLAELQLQIREARQRLKVQIANIVRKIESDYAAARAREAALQAEADLQQQAALNLKELGVQYTLLQGEWEANKSVFHNVLQRLNETSIRSDSPVSTIQIMEPAERPFFPSSPNIPRNLLLSMALGLFLSVGLAFLLEHLDSTLRTPEDVWRAVAVPTLGVVPHMRSLARREYGLGQLQTNSPLRRLAHRWTASGRGFSPALMVSHHPLSFLAESFRTIRTVLLLGQMERSPRVVVITSAHAGEGKTTIVLNLAITLAQSGRSVVVVDADLRKGNCHSHLGISNRYGLTHLLTDSLPLDACVQQTSVAGLALVPRGAVPPNPTDLLASIQMQEFIMALRQRFDFVLIDTPPALAISDAAVLSVMSDGVLLVLRNQSTTTEAARHLIERLQAVGATVLGAVLNGINVKDPNYNDYRRYYSSYYAAAQEEMQN